MGQRVTVPALAATDVTTSHAHASRIFQSALRAASAVNLNGLAVGLFKMWAFAGFYTWHTRFPLTTAHLHRRKRVFHQHCYCQRADATGHRREITGYLSGFARVDVTYKRVPVFLERRTTLWIVSKESFEIFECCDSVHSDVHHCGAWLDIASVNHPHAPDCSNQNVRLSCNRRQVFGARMTDRHRCVIVQ